MIIIFPQCKIKLDDELVVQCLPIHLTLSTVLSKSQIGCEQRVDIWSFWHVCGGFIIQLHTKAF